MSAWKSFVLKIRKSLLSSAIYSKPQSFVESKMSHIHSSHSSIGSSVGFNSVCKSFPHFSLLQWSLHSKVLLRYYYILHIPSIGLTSKCSLARLQQLRQHSYLSPFLLVSLYVKILWLSEFKSVITKNNSCLKSGFLLR